MTLTAGILLFDDAEELDFVGPWEVFTMVNAVLSLTGDARRPLAAVTVSQRGGMIRAAKGLRVEAQHSFETCPTLDIVLVPGGQGTRREVENRVVLEWLARVGANCQWSTSVCTGSLLLTAAGPAKGKRVTTHWAFVDDLRKRGEAAAVLDDVRFVRDGHIVTSAGVSAGIDMALWIVGQLYDPLFARRVQKAMEYFPAPPYTAEA
ncbi:MAG: DJ-1/PfpI family protein [Alphaproteobacteria bacterium]|nr:DJ-1/PfpI family protein [Alphaproteobacteria bacterium]